MKKAVYPWSFDGLTRWHEDIIRREAPNYDQLIIAILKNPEKKTPLFPLEQREKHIKHIIKDLNNVLVLSFEWLLASVCVEHNAMHVIRWIRNDTDLAAEKTYEFYNKMIESQLEYHYIECSPEYFHVSSTHVKWLIQMWWQLNDAQWWHVYTLVHPLVKADIEKALMNQYFIGITWAPGTGKSFISKKFVDYAATQNIPLHYIEMDSIAKIIHDENSPYGHIRDTIAETFPETQRTEQWWIIPSSLRPLFWTPKIDQLWTIMRAGIFNELRKAVQGKQWIILIENALFAEHDICNLVNNNLIVTTVNEETQLQRLHKRPWLDEELIQKLLKSQYTPEEKFRRIVAKSTETWYWSVHLLDNPDLRLGREDKKIYPDTHIRNLFSQVINEIWYPVNTAK